MPVPTASSRLARFPGPCLLLALIAGPVCSCSAVIRGDGFSVEPPVSAPARDLSPEGPQPGAGHEPEDPTPASDPPATNEVDLEVQDLRGRIQAQTGMIRELYRRLHIELDDAGRSRLIVELFAQPQQDLRLLGFELADRDLSSNTVLAPEVGESVKTMLSDESPLIRARAARLVTRLVPPDAMIVLTESLGQEHDPRAAAPMLSGVARWPNADARGAVIAWYARDDAPLPELNAAGWSMAEARLWDIENDQRRILERLRREEVAKLRESGMKLLARYGDADDLRSLVDLLVRAEAPVNQWAASALVETPRAVETLLKVAQEENGALFAPAAEALIKHRANPEGLRRLVQLPAPSEKRAGAVERMGAVIETERLAEAVRLAELPPEQAISLLSRLLTSDEPTTPRRARGILLLAELELDAARPNRALEAVITLENATLEPDQRRHAHRLKTLALLLLGRFDEAMATGHAFDIWSEGVARAQDAELRRRIAKFLLEESELDLSEKQRAELELIAAGEDDH